jgi:methyl-coenzyme M reductase subunit C
MISTNTIGRKTHIVDCRETQGFGIGGGLAQKGTLSEAENPEIVVVAMSPISRHVTKPVCEITYGIREAGIQVSVLVLEAGMGLPQGAPAGTKTSICGVTPREIAQINRHKLALIHVGNIPTHFVYKTRTFLKNATIPAIVICQAPVEFKAFADVGIRVRGFDQDKAETKGELVDIVTGVIRGETVPAVKLEEIIRKVKYWYTVYYPTDYAAKTWDAVGRTCRKIEVY